MDLGGLCGALGCGAISSVVAIEQFDRPSQRKLVSGFRSYH